MLSPIQKVIFDDFKRLIETFFSIFKFGIGIGAACLIYYLIKIEYLPNEISLGDGFVLFFVAIVFAFILTIYIASEKVLGMTICNFFSFLYVRFISKKNREKIYIKLSKILRLKQDRNKFLMIKVRKLDYIFMVPLMVLLPFLWDFSFWEFLWASIIGLVTYLFLIIMYTLSKEYNFFDRFNGHTDDEKDSDFYRGLITKVNYKNKDNQNVIKFSLLILIFFPILYSAYFSNVPFKIISSTMNLVSMRKEKTTLYVKKEFAQIILDSDQILSPYTYYSIPNVTILFKGIGKNTYLEIKKDNEIKRFEIPNDAILNTVIINEK